MNTRHKKPGDLEIRVHHRARKVGRLTQTIEPVPRDTCKSTPKTAEVFVADNFLRLLAAFVVTRVFLFQLRLSLAKFLCACWQVSAHRAWLACCCAGSRSPGGAVAPPAL